MSLNYGQLKAAIEDYLQYNDTIFVDNLPVIIRQAEDRIYQSVQAPVERKNSTGALVLGNPYLAVPSDMLSVASMAVISSGSYNFLMPREVSYVREAYPSPTATGIPKCYALFDQTTFIFGPSPDAYYSVELNYHAKPTSITQGGYNGESSGSDLATTWISVNFESIMLSASILEAYIFLKGDADLIQLYDNRYKEALSTFQLMGEGLDERDSFRNGTKRTQVNP
jgi:hypothetical protein